MNIGSESRQRHFPYGGLSCVPDEEPQRVLISVPRVKAEKDVVVHYALSLESGAVSSNSKPRVGREHTSQDVPSLIVG